MFYGSVGRVGIRVVVPGTAPAPGPVGDGLVWGAGNYLIWGDNNYLVWGP